MPFVTTPERYGIKQGLLQAIESFLQGKYGDDGLRLLPEIRRLNDPAKFQAVIRALATTSSLEDVRRACQEAASPVPPG